jgi:hypothetical protein
VLVGFWGPAEPPLAPSVADLTGMTPKSNPQFCAIAGSRGWRKDTFPADVVIRLQETDEPIMSNANYLVLLGGAVPVSVLATVQLKCLRRR